MKRSLTFATLLLFSALALQLSGAMEPESSLAHAQAPPQPPAQAPPPAQTTPSAGYAGSDTCVTCHTDQEASLKGTKHGQAKNPRSPAAAHGCESCHGPGTGARRRRRQGEHHEVRAMKPADVSETCLTCHNRGAHAGWEGSAHDAAQPVLHDVPQRAHAEVAGAAAGASRRKRSSARPVTGCRSPRPSGPWRTCRCAKARCRARSCHNPHGSISNVKALQGRQLGRRELHVSCHTEMRGPVLFEHAPVRENCATCHDPHGSSNDRMLAVRMPMLCQRCHVATRHPATLYDKDQITTNKSNRMFGRSCVNCHSNVHGSNHPSGQFFMR